MSEKWDAAEAAALVKKVNEAGVTPILVEIFNLAGEGKKKLHIYRSLTGEALDILQAKGFKVYFHPSIDIQKDKLYYTISW